MCDIIFIISPVYLSWNPYIGGLCYRTHFGKWALGRLAAVKLLVVVKVTLARNTEGLYQEFSGRKRGGRTKGIKLCLSEHILQKW